MHSYLRQSTASQVRTIGPFVDDTNFKTVEDGLTIANTDIKLKKNGGESGNKNSGGATADGTNGAYHLTFDATDTNTVGELFGSVDVAGALVITFKFWVLEENVYDEIFAASADLGTDVAAILVDTGTTLDGKIDTIDANVDSILVDTAEIGAAGAGLTAVPWNASWDAEVQSECNDALVAQGLDHMVAAAVVGADVTDDSIVASMVSKSATADWDDFVNTTDSLQAIRDRGDSAWSAGGGNPSILQTTTIATLASPVSFTLTAGSTDDNAYVGCMCVIEDASTSTQKAVGFIVGYTGSTRTVALGYDPGVFTMAETDNIDIIAIPGSMTERLLEAKSPQG